MRYVTKCTTYLEIDHHCAAFWWSGRQVMALSSTLRGLVSKLVRDPPYTNHTTGGAHSAVQQRAVLLIFRNKSHNVRANSTYLAKSMMC